MSIVRFVAVAKKQIFWSGVEAVIVTQAKKMEVFAVQYLSAIILFCILNINEHFDLHKLLNWNARAFTVLYDNPLNFVN